MPRLRYAASRLELFDEHDGLSITDVATRTGHVWATVRTYLGPWRWATRDEVADAKLAALGSAGRPEEPPEHAGAHRADC
jgi:hypothetical protein